MLPRWSRIWSLLCLLLFLDVVGAGRIGHIRRQDDSSTTKAAPKTTHAGEAKSTTKTSPSSSIRASSTTVTLVATPTPSAINETPPITTGTDTVGKGELPLEPRLTPGWGIAGAILLITGVVYTLGIKSTWLHTFFSAAYLASLCTTVLIVYVMTLPVSNAIQGAYVVAAIATGIILGGGATFFKEVTEGLGCLLGGFCLSMWLLTLKEGGLLRNTAGKVVFIASFTIGGIAFYFIRFTRVYALIGSTSFAGATVTVLGIDCFSTAGLKEFWAYIWALNENLFPLGAETYSLTKGIRIEIALIVFIGLVGVVSQSKLWKVIQGRRAKRAEAQRSLDTEEANVGQHVEEQNAGQRSQREATYGGKPKGSFAGSGDSGVGDMNEKNRRDSQTTSGKSPSNDNAIEWANLPLSNSPIQPVLPPKGFSGLIVSNPRNESRVTIRVARDEDLPDDNILRRSTTQQAEKVWLFGADGEARTASMASIRNSQRLSRSTVPEIVPLPFAISERSVIDEDDRSSVAALAGDDDGLPALDKRGSRASLGKRLSFQSGNLLRDLSQRSQNPTRSNRDSLDFPPAQPAPMEREWDGSHKDLVSEKRRTFDTESVAATLDDMSSDGSETRRTVEGGENGCSVEIKADLADRTSKVVSRFAVKPSDKPEVRNNEGSQSLPPYSTADTVARDTIDTLTAGESVDPKSTSAKSTSAVAKTEAFTAAEDKYETPKVSQSDATSEQSTPASLTKDRLPSRFSRVAMSYRTNEWAKHLSQAEMPEPERLQLREYLPRQESSEIEDEDPAPVNIESLQQTAHNATPLPALARAPPSTSSPRSASDPVYRSNSRVSVVPRKQPAAQGSGLTVMTAHSLDGTASTSLGTTSPTNPLYKRYNFQRKTGDLTRRTSGMAQSIAKKHVDGQQGVHNGQVLEDGNESGEALHASSPATGQPNSPGPVPVVVSYSGPQTLLGHREMLLRISPQLSETRSSSPGAAAYSPRHSSNSSSLYNYSVVGQDADDLPLNQRKELLRQSTLISVEPAGGSRPNSNLRMAYVPGQPYSPSPRPAADVDSYQSHRRSLPSQVAREAQLASFRRSVMNDLQAGPPVFPAGNNRRDSLLMSSSMASPVQSPKRDSDVSRRIDYGRSVMLSQQEQEAQRKELHRWEKERAERLFEQRMRNGELIDLHCEAMRKMQSSARGNEL